VRDGLLGAAVYIATTSDVVAVTSTGAVLWSVVVSEASSLIIGGDGTLYTGTMQYMKRLAPSLPGYRIEVRWDPVR
jgi:hypothetical protein